MAVVEDVLNHLFVPLRWPLSLPSLQFRERIFGPTYPQ